VSFFSVTHSQHKYALYSSMRHRSYGHVGERSKGHQRQDHDCHAQKAAAKAQVQTEVNHSGATFSVPADYRVHWTLPLALPSSLFVLRSAGAAVAGRGGGRASPELTARLWLVFSSPLPLSSPNIAAASFPGNRDCCVFHD